MMTPAKLRRILALLDDNAYVAAEHDVIYVGGPAPDNLPFSTKRDLDALGAVYDEGFEAWAVYV